MIRVHVLTSWSRSRPGVLRQGRPKTTCRQLLNAVFNNEGSVLQPKTAIDTRVQDCFPDARIALCNGELAIVVSKFTIKLLKNFHEVAQTQDMLKFGDEVKVEAMHPHHLVAYCKDTSGYFVVDIQASFEEARFRYIRIEENFSHLTAEHLNVFSLAEAKIRQSPDKGYMISRSCTLRVFSDLLKVKAKYQYNLDLFFQNDVFLKPPKPGQAQRYKGAPMPDPSMRRRPLRAAASDEIQPVFTLQLMKDQLLVSKFFMQSRLTFSLLDLKRDNTSSLAAHLEITTDLDMEPQESLDLESICKFKPNLGFACGRIVLLHPQRFLEYSVIRVQKGYLTQIVSFSASRRSTRPLLQQLIEYVPKTLTQVNSSYSRLWDPKSPEGKAQLAKWEDLEIKPPAPYRNQEERGHSYNNDYGITPVHPIQNNGSARIVGQGLYKDPITGMLYLTAEFSKGEAYFRRTTNSRTSLIHDILEIVHSVTTQLKLV